MKAALGNGEADIATTTDHAVAEAVAVSGAAPRMDATDPRRKILRRREGHVPNADRDLLSRAADGDEAAARIFFAAHVDAVFRAVCRVLGRSHPDVDDVVQQVFLCALAQHKSFEARSRMSTWMVGIAIRKSIDAVRSSQRRGRWAKMKGWVGMAPVASTDPSSRLEAKAEFAERLARLTVDQRAIFILIDVEQYTLKEAALMLEVGLSTLHARLKNARIKLSADEASAEESLV